MEVPIKMQVKLLEEVEMNWSGSMSIHSLMIIFYEPQ